LKDEKNSDEFVLFCHGDVCGHITLYNTYCIYVDLRCWFSAFCTLCRRCDADSQTIHS